ncbi:MAG: N-6 DNA methylase [Prevotellaceae bacterium]|nr:N-6 DNA methylase [Prevotellaceae bacterium]
MNNVDYIKKLFDILGFTPKENTAGIYSKKYSLCEYYAIEIDIEKGLIDYGDRIKSDSKTTQNFSQPENFVVLECVNRLLEKGYKPQHIILEKTWAAGHGTSGRLDICVTRDNGDEYLLIECKTYGKEFEKELAQMKKDGGQLFTYFKFSNKADIIMLYASELQKDKIIFRNEIVKIEDDYRTGDVKDFYQKWNKQTYNKGVWENPPYGFQLEKFTKADLKELTEDEGKKLFHGFATILRKHSVSDKPNAFNVIFNLFLAKLYDEQKGDNDELEFKWRTNEDPVDFQIRLHNLHKEGLNDFLKKEIEGIKDEDFAANLTPEQIYIAKKRLLKFNKFFTIKDVFDDETFDQNHRVLKEVVQLIEKYQIRYPRKQKYLSEFFELLLTTGLKQEVGQYFTPPPIAKFIVKSLPLPAMIRQELNNPTPSLPAVIDYAAGSGHFITEIMEEYQDIIDSIDTLNFYPNAKTKVKVWSQKDGEAYSWASSYIYGIEKDYRLVKVAKVGCYFYGDGVAQIIHGDGLDSLTKPPKSYTGLLKENAKKPQFSVIVSNPPYSVNDCKDDLEYIGAQNDFTLYNYLTDKSREIETLFVERTRQLLKEGGVAGIILPTAILNSTGIYAKTRALLLQHFEIISIVELGVNTFMATKIRTVIMFLRRRNNNDSIRLAKFIENFFVNFQDNNPTKPFNIIEKPVSKYVNYIWGNLTFDDYISLLKKEPNNTVKNSEIYKEYRKKIKSKTEKDFWNILIEIEKEKLLYFILLYQQKVVLVKTGDKEEEKQFLGYEFSEREKQEGIHSFIKGKEIEECTKLFDTEHCDNPQKASTYIYKAFNGQYDLDIYVDLKQNIEYVNLIDLIDFQTANFDLKIEKTQKININYSDIWNSENIQSLSKIAVVEKGKSITKSKTGEGNIPVIAGGQTPAYYHNEANRKGNIVTISASGAYAGFVNYFDIPIFASDCNTIKSLNENEYSTKLIYYCLKTLQSTIYKLQRGQAQPHVYKEDLEKIKIPAFNKTQAKQVITEIEELEEKSKTFRIDNLEEEIERILKKYLQ